MSFPQPSSVAPVLAGQQSFRLRTQLASAGDLYESEVSALAFAIGPDSDIANVRVNYFDSNADAMVGQANISPERTLVGRVDARNETVYPGGGQRRGRILLSALDLYDPTWRPSGYVPDDDAIEFVAPMLDVIQYFVNPPSLISQRSDRTFRFQYLTVPPNGVGADGITYLVIPAYGRKSGYFTFKNITNGISTVHVDVGAVRFGESAAPGPDGSAQVFNLFTVDLVTQTNDDWVYQSSTDGLWDMFFIRVGNKGMTPLSYPGGAFPITVTLSDDPQ